MKKMVGTLLARLGYLTLLTCVTFYSYGDSSVEPASTFAGIFKNAEGQISAGYKLAFVVAGMASIILVIVSLFMFWQAGRSQQPGRIKRAIITLVVGVALGCVLTVITVVSKSTLGKDTDLNKTTISQGSNYGSG